jgi:hypothetical protein
MSDELPANPRAELIVDVIPGFSSARIRAGADRSQRAAGHERELSPENSSQAFDCDARGDSARDRDDKEKDERNERRRMQSPNEVGCAHILMLSS